MADEKQNQTKKAAVSTNPHTETPSKLSKIKLGFLYLLIGGLIASALISVIALLFGSLDQIAMRALSTTLVVVTFGTLLLLIVLVDSKNQIGRDIIPSIIPILVVTQMISSILGIWQIIPADVSGRLTWSYFIILGGAFLVSGALSLNLPERFTRASAYTSCVLIGLLILLVLPWAIIPNINLGEFYFRLIGASAILSVTTLVITVILNRINIRSFKQPSKASQSYSSGMMAIAVTLGVITTMIWLTGIPLLINSASSAPEQRRQFSSRSIN